MLIFHIKCPKCHHVMKYSSKDQFIKGKRKNCVYCNFSIDIRKNLTKEPKKTDFQLKNNEFPGFKNV